MILEGTRVKPEWAATVGKWDYIDCHCMVNLGRSGVHFVRECEACGNTNLRFIHTLENLEGDRQIEVGIECASVLLDDYETPKLAENETKRKERWRIIYRRPGRCSTTPEDLENRGKL